MGQTRQSHGFERVETKDLPLRLFKLGARSEPLEGWLLALPGLFSCRAVAQSEGASALQLPATASNHSCRPEHGDASISGFP
jgi:hypothetical protein